MLRRALPILAVLLIGLANPPGLVWGGQATPPSDPPSVVLLVLDATRLDHLSGYGFSKETTPRIDALARTATVYDQCIAAAPWTLPSVASLLTGLFPQRHGVNCKNLNLRDIHTTLAERLSQAGYRTAGFSGNPWVGSFSGLSQGFDVFQDIWRTLGQHPADAGASNANERALDWIDSVPEGVPYFLYVHYMEPHFPYRPPIPFDRAFESSPLEQPLLDRVRAWRTPRELGFILKDPGSAITPAEMAALRVQYEGEIGYVDQQLGALVDALARRNRLERTMLIITADHGEHLGEHELLDHKFSVYESLIRVPLIVRFPGGEAAGERIQQQVQNVDLVPTVLRQAGLRAAFADGIPLPLNNDPAPTPRTAYTEFSRPALFTGVIEQHFPAVDFSAIDRALLSVRTDRYKLIWVSDGRHELFDLVTDPGEEKNLINSLPDIAEHLLAAARKFQEEGP